ncbi:hypothetical protein FHS18_005000 [Paenibacillus phyllosphaerae]|uniref:Uncharacterized protein n=1 Tax=Paenibacillus phyllosphaerae TaxID=274593 RepID=A0A7W5B206_9BACL|nr:hypothetical protein [Paenibacillus phyllosphaerae]MBB3112898.1 hypothetical protein [Paenibacillus phyllosphaerae]
MNKPTIAAELIIEQLQISSKCFEVWKELNLSADMPDADGDSEAI